jgi:hypothetical protein
MQIEAGYDIHFQRMQTKQICIISSFQPLVKIRSTETWNNNCKSRSCTKFGQGKKHSEATDIKADKQVSFSEFSSNVPGDPKLQIFPLRNYVF